MVMLSFVLIFSGFGLDGIDKIVGLSDPAWNLCSIIATDAQMLGALILANTQCPYSKLRLKGATFFLCVWRFTVLIINAVSWDASLSLMTVAILSCVFFLWLYRLSIMEPINSREPGGKEAYYIFMPINTFMGLFQAVFMPWYPARYETRMIVDGHFIWSVHRGVFSKKMVVHTDMEKLNGIKIPFGRRLQNTELMQLNSNIGKRAIPGFRDCRKFLIV